MASPSSVPTTSQFDAATITAPAGQPFTVAFTNLDSVPHNFSVYVEEGGDVIVEGRDHQRG